VSIAAALEISVLFVCIWGFIAIMLTGQFGIPIIVLCSAALIVGYYVRRRGWRPSPLTANISAIFVFIVAASIFVTSYNLLSATVHLFLFLQVTKYITRRTLVENRWCYVISLFNIIGASVITTTITFGPVLIVYIFLILISLRLYVLAREAEKVETCTWRKSTRAAGSGILRTLTGPKSRPMLAGARVPLLGTPSPGALYYQQVRLPRHMISSGILLTIAALAMSAGLFSIIPRLATQNLFQSYGQPQQESSVSAFSENVEFGSFTEIQLDESVALFVQPTKKERPPYVRMRGVALDEFDGKAWRRSGGSFNHSGMYEYQPIFTTRIFPKTYKFRVLQPPGITTFLFGDSFPTKLHVPNNTLYQVDRMAQTVALLEPPPKEFQYEVESMHEDPLLRRDPVTIKNPDRPTQGLIPRTATPGDDSESEDEHDDETAVSDLLSFFGAVSEVAREEAMKAGTSSTRAITPDDQLTTRPAGSNSQVSDLVGRPPTWDGRDYRSGPYDELTTGGERSRGERARWRRGRSGYTNYRRLSGPEYLQMYLRRCLEVPENLSTGRVPELARQWTSDAPTTFAKAMAVETRLRTSFGYSLTPRARGNYIESFLFDVKEGHCEYFATSMAVLLRDLGIPARVVNGFYSTEWNALSENFTVRQKDAHSWVEAWMGDNYGWMTFDPTPPSGVARRNDRGALMEGLSRLSDAVRMRWYRYVIDYSFSDQVQILRDLSHWRERMLRSLKNLNILGVTSKDAKTIEQGGLAGRIDWRPIAIALGIIGLLLGWQGMRWLGRRRVQYSPIRYYDELLKLLARRGMRIHAGETPQEFARRVSNARPEWAAFTGLTHIYYKARYNRAEAPDASRRWFHSFTIGERSLTKQLSADELRAYADLRRAMRQRKKT
jgi:transglutaminase-like putative cysteine protease